MSLRFFELVSDHEGGKTTLIFDLSAVIQIKHTSGVHRQGFPPDMPSTRPPGNDLAVFLADGRMWTIRDVRLPSCHARQALRYV